MLAFWIGAKFYQINRVEPNLYYKKFGSAKICPRFGTTNILVGFQTKQAHNSPVLRYDFVNYAKLVRFW